MYDLLVDTRLYGARSTNQSYFFLHVVDIYGALKQHIAEIVGDDRNR